MKSPWKRIILFCTRTSVTTSPIRHSSIRTRRLTFSFARQRSDLEQSAFVQDLTRLGNWTVDAGLRWDHYPLQLYRQAVGPRFSVSRYFPSADMVLHFSYDRVFQTPSFENILLRARRRSNRWILPSCACWFSLQKGLLRRGSN